MQTAIVMREEHQYTLTTPKATRTVDGHALLRARSSSPNATGRMRTRMHRVAPPGAEQTTNISSAAERLTWRGEAQPGTSLAGTEHRRSTSGAAARVHEERCDAKGSMSPHSCALGSRQTSKKAAESSLNRTWDFAVRPRQKKEGKVMKDSRRGL